MILITGATGNVGTELARVLAARGVSFRAMVRSPESAKQIEALAGAELVAGDFDDPASLARPGRHRAGVPADPVVRTGGGAAARLRRRGAPRGRAAGRQAVAAGGRP
jgi:uncharacterized protein YbjT (DUF2867 family)